MYRFSFFSDAFIAQMKNKLQICDVFMRIEIQNFKNTLPNNKKMNYE